MTAKDREKNGAAAEEGLPLAEMGEKLAQMMTRGADPYVKDAESAKLEGWAGAPEAAEVGGDLTPRSIVEAMLFVGSADNSPLTSEQAAGMMRGVRPAEVDELIRDLNQEYAANRCPYEIVSQGAGYLMQLREEHARIREKFYAKSRRARLSPAAIEALAVVAYNQPVTAELVTRLRGSGSDSLLSQLVRRGLLRIERGPDRKTPPNYFTTDRFLQVFGVSSLAELPQPVDVERPTL